METQTKYIDDIIHILKQVKFVRDVYLFGSFATGNIREDSDIDLLVILNRDDALESYDQRIDFRKEIIRALRPVNKDIGIDILLYTKSEWSKLLDNGGSFHKEINDTSVKII